MRSDRTAEGEGGFTLIELLVVIVIVAILAAIAIPVFFAQREKGYRSQVVHSLRDAATTMQAWAAEHGGDYTPEPPGGSTPGNSAGDMGWLQDQGWRTTEGVSLDIAVADNFSFCLSGSHDIAYSIQLEYRSTAGSVEEGDCT